MNNLFLERLVEVTSEEMIDSLRPRSVVYVKNQQPRVFDRREGDTMIFYYPNIMRNEVVVELKTPRGNIGNVGNIVYFQFGGEERGDLTSQDGDYYLERKNDLVALGLMK